MAEKKDASSADRVVDEAPSLPSQIVEVSRDLPTIDQALIEARNREAKAQADRLKG
jgi:hypothetical protein